MLQEEVAFPTDWDVEQYRNEPAEHWRLSRSFIEAHKHNFPEARLVYLAQSFANMEYFGCRYSEKMTQLLNTLSADLADDPWCEQQNNMQKTLVHAPDGAKSKVTQKRVMSVTNGGSPANSLRWYGEEPAANSAAFILVEYGDPCLDDNPESQLMNSSEFCNISVRFSLVGNACECRVGGDLVGRGTPYDDPITGHKTAREAAAAEAVSVLKTRCYTIRPRSEMPAGEAATHWNPMMSEDRVGRMDEQEAAQQLADGVGGRMLAMMGWTGGGLGKHRQGITEPVRLQEFVAGREGLGSKKRTVPGKVKEGAQGRGKPAATGAVNEKSEVRRVRKHYRALQTKSQNKGKKRLDRVVTESVRVGELVDRQDICSNNRTVTTKFRHKAKLRLRAYASKFRESCLIFGSDFTKDECKAIREIGNGLHLLSEGQGKGRERCLVVSHRVNPHHLLRYLIDKAGQSNEYEIVPPGGEVGAW